MKQEGEEEEGEEEEWDGPWQKKIFNENNTGKTIWIGEWTQKKKTIDLCVEWEGEEEKEEKDNNTDIDLSI